ncbi:MAG TPA: transaldolase family protein [Bacteroidales bacterium]|nr:transaldolase family protein [Bacteroidales bacterium]HRZ48006.1 transaldolase family protein [Bacteroidales bacterium]
MELYLDSANIAEIEEATSLGIIAGLTTTPTFMHRDGVTDIDQLILKLAGMVPVLQVEALGETTDEIIREAERLIAIGLDPAHTVFKVPVSMEGIKACRILINKGYQVNIHLVYTLQQAYMALSAGATYVCPLVGRLQDEGHDALGLIRQCVEVVDRYRYPSKIMFSSVRNSEHVRNALNLGAHCCTIPWKVMQQLFRNHFTDIGTQQFFEHTRLMTLKVRQVISPMAAVIPADQTILDALMIMTRSKFGAVSITDETGNLKGIFTDGDLRRLLEHEGEHILHKKLCELSLKMPVCIDADESLYNASLLFKAKKIDNIVVTEEDKPIGIMDIHDLFNTSRI